MPFDTLVLDSARRDLDALSASVFGWIDPRTDLTTDLGKLYPNHNSQLRALRGWFDALLAALRQRLDAAPTIDVARQVRRSALGLFGLWDVLRQRLQQREGPKDLRAVFIAADDVAFGCREPAVAGMTVGPPPLPFLSFDADPRMFPSGSIPETFARAIGQYALAQVQQTWPLSMVHLPVSCTWAPWWLVILGHEVGHQVQYDLKLKDSFAAQMRAAAQAAGRPDYESATWSAWGVEIFADAYSVLTMGRAAVRALFEIVYDQPHEMQRRHEAYPPAVIRLELMNRYADAIRLKALPLPVKLKPIIDGHEDTRGDAKVIDAVVAVLRGPLSGPGSATLADYAQHGHPSPFADVREFVQDSFARYVRREALAEDDAKQMADTLLKNIASVPLSALRGPEQAVALTQERAAKLADSLLGVNWSTA